MITQLAYLFDTSPLLTLATPVIDSKPAIVHLLPIIKICVVKTVAREATIKPQYRDAAVVRSLLDAGHISELSVPATAIDEIIAGYTSISGGKGERDTIRLGTTDANLRVVIDDQAAFFVAARFDLQPIVLLDLIVELVRSKQLKKTLAKHIVDGVAQTGRYSTAAVKHTIYKLDEVASDPNNN